MDKNTFYIFSGENNKKFNKKIVVKQIIEIILNPKLTQRLSYFDIPNLPHIYLYILDVDIVPESESAIENGRYIEDSNSAIHELLEADDSLYGSSSYKINKILNAIIKVDEANTARFLGQGNLKSLNKLYKILKEAQVSYVVLRKYDLLESENINTDNDIDILCDSKDEMILATGAEKRNIGISAYRLTINNTKIDFDIRYKGDNYIDPQWSKDILDNRISKNAVSIIDNTNELFTIIYHCLTQKKNISPYYRQKIKIMSERLFGKSFPIDEKELCRLLSIFMKTKGYSYFKPKDSSVMQNRKNIRRIKKYTKKTNWKKEIIRNVYIKVPHSLDITPKKIKEKIIKL